MRRFSKDRKEDATSSPQKKDEARETGLQSAAQGPADPQAQVSRRRPLLGAPEQQQGANEKQRQDMSLDSLLPVPITATM